MKPTANPPHPGDVLREYLGSVTVTEAAAKLAVSRDTLSRLLRGTSGVSAEMAIRLGLALGTSPDLWAGLQSKFDLHQASKRRRPKVARIITAFKDKFIQDLKGLLAPSAGTTVSIEDMRSGADEDLLWDRMAPVGREFGSPDYERLLEIDTLAFKAFGTPKKARRWLNAPHPDLDGQTPELVCRTDLGFKKVKRLLRAAEAKAKGTVRKKPRIAFSEYTTVNAAGELVDRDGRPMKNPYKMSLKKAGEYARKAGIVNEKGELNTTFK